MQFMDQAAVDQLMETVNAKVEGQIDNLRELMHRGVPPGMEKLDSPEKKQVVGKMLSQRADQEQRGAVPGNMNQTALDHPSVRRLFAEEEGMDEAPGDV